MRRSSWRKVLNVGGFDLKRALELEPDFLKASDEKHMTMIMIMSRSTIMITTSTSMKSITIIIMPRT